MGQTPFSSAIDVGLAVMSEHDLRRTIPIIRASFFEDHYPKLKTISLPCVAIGGDADQAARPWHTERIAREIPDARAVSVKGSGHLINWEAPEAIIDVIRELVPPMARATG